ncbi:helix-turn-helix domain-containing protein [Porcipelethomonas sp.]|uniref:helix-turn-helix domain-containing protein n=1 Tax=Porcipelethomonas sp. TaxID=2981675 RepID=UPI003EF9A7E6
MTFPKLLNEYISILNCTASELAKASGLTPASLSRYRNGQRIPETDTLKKLAAGITGIAHKNGQTDISCDCVFSRFMEELGVVDTDNTQFSCNFENLVNTLQINLNELAKSMGYDPSYLSRIKKGQRIPADINEFAESLSRFLMRKYSDSEETDHICKLIGYIPESGTPVHTDFTAAVINYLCSSEAPENTKDGIGDYLKKLDEFDLNEYITIIKFDKLKVPTAPFSLPSSKNYYGIDQMKQGELDFFKATALSRSREPIFMNSDMPMADMAEDMEFNKKWMFGIAACLKKGLHMNMIHNVDRPMNEMILGLEAWIPIYMTGQITPYYLKNLNTNIYHHLNYVSGAAALAGECINGHHDDGKYYLTNSRQEVAYYRNKSNHILSKAFPLMDIFTEESKDKFYSFLSDESKKEGELCNLHATLPLYTISDELFKRILEQNHISNNNQQMFLEYLNTIKKYFIQTVTISSVEDMIPVISKEEYTVSPLTLSLSGAFYEHEIYYTYEEYLEHYNQTMALAEKYQNYTVSAQHTRVFKNIQIQMKHGEWVLISKHKSPVIHFVIRHPKMVRAIECGLPW